MKQTCGGCHQWGHNPDLDHFGCRVCERTREQIVEAHGCLNPCAEVERYKRLVFNICEYWRLLGGRDPEQESHLLGVLCGVRNLAEDTWNWPLSEEMVFLMCVLVGRVRLEWTETA